MKKLDLWYDGHLTASFKSDQYDWAVEARDGILHVRIRNLKTNEVSDYLFTNGLVIVTEQQR